MEGLESLNGIDQGKSRRPTTESADKRRASSLARERATSRVVEPTERQLGARIARHRKALGLTQSQLAEMVRVQPETICRLETAVGTPSLPLVTRTAAAIHLELWELFRFKEPTSQKELAIERLNRFASRLSAAEVRLILDTGAAVIQLVRVEKNDGP